MIDSFVIPLLKILIVLNTTLVGVTYMVGKAWLMKYQLSSGKLLAKYAPPEAKGGHGAATAGEPEHGRGRSPACRADASASQAR